MAEFRIGESLSCAQCGSPFERRSRMGKVPLRCPSCAAQRSKEQVRRACAVLAEQGYFRARWHSLPKWERPQGCCDLCAAPFTPHVPAQRYCSKKCRAKADSRKPNDARPLYRYARWKALRAEQLKAEPHCRFCALVGIKTEATVCDHVVPHRGNVEAFWSGPFQSLCIECHNRTKQRIERSAA